MALGRSPALFASVLADNGLKLADQIDSWANGAYKVPTISDVVTIFER